MRRYKFKTAAGVCEDTTVTLSDVDTVYTEVRHLHMREAIDKLVGDFNDFLKENAGFKGYGRQLMKSLPDPSFRVEKVL